MMDMTGLVERTPEAQRRRAAEHERLALAIAQYQLRMQDFRFVYRNIYDTNIIQGDILF
jgi:hypothetical protein